jgi:hypothetical protein
VLFAFNVIYTRNSFGALPNLFENKIFTGVSSSVRRWKFTKAASEKIEQQKFISCLTVTYGRSIQAA